IMSLDIAAIRIAKRESLARLFLKSKQRQSPLKTTNEILDAIRQESLPPTIFSTWLTVSKTNDALVLALKQDFSCLVRRHAITELGRRMQRACWERIWDIVGGVDGMLALFADFSVTEIKQACRLLGKRKRSLDSPTRECCIEHLLRALVPFYHNTSNLKSTDQRPLIRFYAQLVPSCSTAFVCEVLDGADNPLSVHVQSAHIARYHPTLVYKIIDQYGCVDMTAATIPGCRWSCYPRLTHDLPTNRRHATGFSPTMHFLLKLLDESASSNLAGIPTGEAVKLISAPLLRLAIKNKVSEDMIMHIISTTLNYMERQYLAMGWNRLYIGSFLEHLASFWSRRGATTHLPLDKALCHFLQLYGANQSHGVYRETVEVVSGLFPVVHRGHRYALLQHIMKHFTKPETNLDDAGCNKSIEFREWSCKWFTDMDPSEASSLLKRLIQSRKEHNFLSLERNRTIFNHPTMPEGRHADPGLLLTYLSRGQEGSLTNATTITRQTQKKSETSREQADRAFYAKSALFYAIASGSITLYHDTLTWSRRFVKDPMTARKIFGGGSVLTIDGIELLTGMYSHDPPHAPLREADHWQIEGGNRILLGLFDIACSSLNEPSFNVNDWDGMKQTYRMVIEQRMRAITSLQRGHHASEKMINERVWRPTIDMLIELERTACKPKHERLSFYSAAGPLSYGATDTDGDNTNRFSSVCYTFLDTLASARDELWKAIRPSYNPAAITLEEPWPKGLPVQCLVPFDIGFSDVKNSTPYLSSRMAKVVFTNGIHSAVDIPRDQEIRSAIGAFVDSYEFALRLHILQTPQGRLRYEEVTGAWQHVIKITRGRMNEEEATRLWRPYFERALPFFKLDLPRTEMESREYPILPQFEGGAGLQEWDPASDQPTTVISRSITARAIDCYLYQPSAIFDVFAPFVEPQVSISAFEPSPLWTVPSAQRGSGAVEEGLIASALLYLDSTGNKGSRILAKPFPSSTQTRYPSLILESESLVSQNHSSNQATEILQAMIDRTPPSLLLQLATGLLGTQHDTVQTTIACQLLALATKSDQPHIASELISKVIIGRPETSAWHRQLLSRSFLNRLSATKCLRTLKGFARAIEAKLNKGTENTTKDDPMPQPAVKMTTVKHLAQLLNQSSFISPRESLDILRSLFQKSTHRDIHIAVAEAMLATLTESATTGSSTLTNEVLQALQGFIPIIGRLSERSNIEEKDWDAFRHNGKIPAKEDPDSVTPTRIPPLFGLLLEYASNGSIPEKIRQAMVQDIILPAYESSKVVDRRDVTVLLSHTGHAEDVDILSTIPPRPGVLLKMLRQIPELLPERYFMEWHDYVKMNLTPGADLVAAVSRVIDHLKPESISDPLLPPSTDASLHWTRFLDQRPHIIAAFSFASLLPHQSSHQLSDHLISLFQTLVLEQADIIIKSFDEIHQTWRSFLSPLRPPKSQTATDRTKMWEEHCAPILNAIIDRVEAYRNDAQWRDNPSRKPQFLPPIFDLRLMLIESIHHDEYAKIAGEVLNLLNTLIDSGRPYHRALNQTKNRFFGSLRTEAQVHIACILGTIDDTDDNNPSIIDFLRVDLAHWLLRHADRKREGSDAIREAFKKSEVVLASWKRSKVEELRMRGAVGFDRVTWADLDGGTTRHMGILSMIG
ncbi:MAG: hypothetical protein Q9180_003109, partial [Flavoplaca navasiana]